MLRDSALIALTFMFLVVVVVLGVGLFFQTVQNVGLAIGLFVVSYILIPWTFGKALTSNGEVFEFVAYLKYLGYWTGLIVFIILVIGFIPLLSAI